MSVPAYHVRLKAPTVGVTLDLLLGESAPRFTAGFGGWEVVARPQDIAMTLWRGNEPRAVQFGVMLDTLRYGERWGDVSADLAALLSLARGARNSRPPLVQVEGLDLPAIEWFIETVELDDPLLRADTAKPVRQAVALTLREYVAPEFVPVRAVPARVVIYHVKAGDTPASIARRRKVKWTAIRDLNPVDVRKANQKLKAGQLLRVPPLATPNAKGK